MTPTSSTINDFEHSLKEYTRVMPRELGADWVWQPVTMGISRLYWPA